MQGFFHSGLLICLLAGPASGAEYSLVGTITSIEPANSLAVIGEARERPIVLRAGGCLGALCIREIHSTKVLARMGNKNIVITRDGNQSSSWRNEGFVPLGYEVTAEPTAAAVGELPTGEIDQEAYERLNADLPAGEPAVPVSQEAADSSS